MNDLPRGPAEADELAEMNAMYAQAVALWDTGWRVRWEDYPGLVMKGDAPMIVSLPVWFFLRGILFGIGQASEWSRQER